MTYHVKVLRISDSGDGISVEAHVEGTPVSHTFPKGLGFFEEPENGKPKFVEKLEERYEDKMRRKGNASVESATLEEAKVDSGEFQNKEYGDTENFKEENNVNNSMTDVDLSNPEEIRRYLKENMAEGYLSEDEGMNIDEFVNEYARLLEVEKNMDEIVKEAIGVETR